MKKPLTILFVASALLAVGQNADKRTLNDAYDGWGEGKGRTINVDAGPVEILGESQTKLLQVKDTMAGVGSSWLQVFGNGSIRTGTFLDLTGFGLDDGRAYPYVDMPLGSFVSGVNNQITDDSGSPINVGSSVTGISNTINNSHAALVSGAGNVVSGSTASTVIGGGGNVITNADKAGIFASSRSTIGPAAEDASCIAIIGSAECYADSALSFVGSSFQSGARGDHATVIAGTRAYAYYYHQVMFGNQPIVDTVGFTFQKSSGWQLNNKTFTIGNYGKECCGSHATNSLTQIANGNMLLGTHWKDVYDDLDTNSAILTVMNDSVGGDMIFAAVNKNRDTTFTISENSFRYVDGNQAAGTFLISDASGNAHWTNIGQSPLTAKNDTTGLEREMSAFPIALATIESLVARVAELEAKLTAAGILE